LQKAVNRKLEKYSEFFVLGGLPGGILTGVHGNQLTTADEKVPLSIA
jgi:hypothetical protein